MSNLYILLIIEIVMCCLVYLQTNGVFVAPTFLSFLTLTISTGFAVYGNLHWKIDISYYTVIIVFTGMLAMLLAASLAKHTRKKKYLVKEECHIVDLNRGKYQFMIIICIVCTVLYCLDIIRAGYSLGSMGLDAIYAVKMDRQGTNVLIRQGVKIIMALAFVHGFLFVNNYIICKERNLRNFVHIIPILCGMICCIFTSVRTDILRLLSALIVCFCVMFFQQRNWKSNNLGKVIRKITPIILICSILMVVVKNIVKGADSTTNQAYNFIQYIAYYIGSPIVVLGIKNNMGVSMFKGQLFGETTLSGIWDILQNIGLFANYNIQNRSVNVWIDRGNRITANVDTVFGAPWIDFGLLGMFIYIFIIYFLLNIYFFKYIYRTKSSNNRNRRLIIYSYFASICTMAYYGNMVSLYISSYYIITLILIIIICRYYKIDKDIAPIDKDLRL